MVSIGQIRIRNAVLCEDVREEVRTNKHILIGTFSGDIRFGGPLPAPAQFALYLDIQAPAGFHPFEIRFSGPGPGSAVLDAAINMGENGYGTITTPRMNITMQEEGIFRLDGRIPGGRWINIFKKRVYVDPAIASPPPSEQSLPDAPDSSSQP